MSDEECEPGGVREFLDEVEAFGLVTLTEAGRARAKSLYCTNSSGLLWEKMWKYEDGAFWSITAASGVFVPWRRHESRADAARAVAETMATIERVRKEG